MAQIGYIPAAGNPRTAVYDTFTASIEAAIEADVSAVNAQLTALEAVVNALALSGGGPIYADAATGLAATSDGDVFLVSTPPGVEVYQNDAGFAEFLGWLGEILLDDVSDLVAWDPPASPAEGTIIRTRSGGFSYAVAAAGASDYHLATAGGTKLYVLPGAGSLPFAAFGTADAATLNAAIAAAAEMGVPVALDQSTVGADLTITGTVSVKTWAPVVARGRVNIDASGISDTAFAIDGATPPAGLPSDVFEPAATTFGGVAGGAIVLTGPGVDQTGTTGVIVGYDTTGASANENVRAKLDSLIVQDFETGVQILNKNTYLIAAHRLTVLRSTTALRLGDGSSGSNAGERLSFTDCNLVGRDFGADVQSAGMNADFHNCSFDFCRLAAIHLTDAARYLHVNVIGGWFEESCDEAFVWSELGSSNASLPSVNIDGVRTVPTTTSQTEADNLGRSLPDHGRTDGKSSQRALFRGKMRLRLNNMDFPFERNNHSAENGLFLCDENVQLIGLSGINFPAWPQMPHYTCIGNHDWDLGDIADGTELGAGISPVFPGAAGAIQPVHSDDRGLGARTTSLKFVSDADDRYANMQTLPVRVTGAQALAVAAWYCGGTAGTLESITYIHWFADDWRQPDQVASVSVDGGGYATFTTPAAHGLVVNDVIGLVDTAGTYRRFRVSTVASATTFVVLTDTSSVTLGASVAYSHVGPVSDRAISEKTQYCDVEAQYDDADFAGYTGDRAWWVRPYACHERQVPAGAAWVTARASITGVDNGETVYLGGLALAQWD